MGMWMPETCWAVFKRQVINFRSCCISLVDSVESIIMHGLANPKFCVKLVIYKDYTEIHGQQKIKFGPIWGDGSSGCISKFADVTLLFKKYEKFRDTLRHAWSEILESWAVKQILYGIIRDQIEGREEPTLQLRSTIKTNVEMSAGRNTSDAFVILCPLHFKFPN